MDPNSGRIYDELQYAALPPERQKELVVIEGTEAQVMAISAAVKADRRRQNKAARKARRHNR